MNSIKGIIFDLGYTLIEYRECSWPEVLSSGLRQVYKELSKKTSHLPDYENFKDLFATVKEKHRLVASRSLAGWQLGDVFRELLAGFDISPDDDLITELSELVYAPSREYMYVADGTIPTLKTLKDTGLTLGIISNTIYPPDFHDADLERFGFGDLFDFRIYSSVFAHRKPHPSIFEAGIDKVGAEADKIIYVGDNFDNDILGARLAGMLPILKYCPRQKYPDPLPDDDPIIDNLGGLLQLPNITLYRSGPIRKA